MATNQPQQARVRAVRGFYAAELLADGTWSRNPVPHAAGSVFVMRLKEAVEAQQLGKARILKDEPVPDPAPAYPAAKKAKE